MAWDRIPYPWETSSLPDYDTYIKNNWIPQYGDRKNAYRDKGSGTVYFPGSRSGPTSPTYSGSDIYHRRTLPANAGGNPATAPESLIPLGQNFQHADSYSNNPWRNFAGYNGPNWQNGDGSLKGMLGRAQVADAWENTKDVPGDQLQRFRDLRQGSEIMRDMQAHLANITDADISKPALQKIDIQRFFGKNLDQPLNLPGIGLLNMAAPGAPVGQWLAKQFPGANPNAIAFLNDLARLRNELFVPGTAKPGEAPQFGAGALHEILGGSPAGVATAAGLDIAGKGAEALYNWSANKDNLNELRRTLPQDYNATNRALYDTVRNNPTGRWTGDVVDYANRIGANATINHDDDPYSKSNPIAEPNAASPTLVNAPELPLPPRPQQGGATTQQPSAAAPGAPAAPAQPAQPAQPGAAPITQLPRVTVTGQAPTVQPQVDPNTPFGQRLLQTLGHFFTFSLGRHGQPQQTTQAQPQPTATATPATPVAAPTRRTATATATPRRSSQASDQSATTAAGAPTSVYSGDPETAYPSYTPSQPSQPSPAQEAARLALNPGEVLQRTFPQITQAWQLGTHPDQVVREIARRMTPQPPAAPVTRRGQGGGAEWDVPTSAPPTVVYSGDPTPAHPARVNRPATVRGEGGGADWGSAPSAPAYTVPPGWGTATSQGPGPEVWGASTTSAAPARGQPQLVAATHQDHVDALEPGTAFTWPDGNTYVKTA